MKKKMVLNVILVVAILMFCGSACYLLRYAKGVGDKKSELSELQELRDAGEAEDETAQEVVSEEGKKVLKAYRKLYKKNSDLVGWICVENTPIDYPVMQTKKDAEYYLHRNYAKNEDVNGLPFLDASCDVDDVKSNLMIYGHHMKSGLMFAKLTAYEAQDFYKAHPVIRFDTLYEKREYEVIAAFYSQVYKENEDVFRFYTEIGHLGKKQFANFVKNVKKLSRYDTKKTAVYGEQLITLVTCAYHTENGRFVVVAKRKDLGNNE